MTRKYYEFKDILELNITQEVNEHTRLYISGTIREMVKQEQDYVQKTVQGTPVASQYVDQRGTNMNILDTIKISGNKVKIQP